MGVAVLPWLEVVATRPFEENTILIGDLAAREAIVVDPGGATEKVHGILRTNGLRLVAIVATHAHIDHVAGAEALRSLTGSPFQLHPEAQPMLAALGQQALMFGLPPVAVPVVDGTLTGGQELTVGQLRLVVVETPGHAPGHITLVTLPDASVGASHRVALCGDVIFRGSIGRTDLPGGDYATLMRSIEREILSLPDDTVLYSGHGPETTVGLERRHNMFVLDWIARGAAGRAAGEQARW
jgi:hydroxyacylglutathione hydrolase